MSEEIVTKTGVMLIFISSIVSSDYDMVVADSNSLLFVVT